MRADNRRLKSDLAKSRAMFKRSFTRIGRGIKGALSGSLGVLTGIGAGVGITSVAKDVLAFEDTLNRLSIQSGVTGKELAQFKGDLVALSADTGISRNELIKASEALVNLTGTAGFSAEKLKVLADANLATGASVEELAGLTFSLEKSFKLADPKQLRQGLSAIIQAGKEGAIPLGQMATVLQSVSASFAELGGTGVDAAADLSSALQVLRGQGFATAAEAGTGLQSVITALTKKSKQLEKKGIDVFDKNGAFRGLRPILDDFQAANLSIAELTTILGRVEAQKGIRALISADGRKEFEKLSEAARKSTALEDDAAKRRQSTAFKLQKTLNRAKETIAKVFTPERIQKFVELIAKAADLLGFIVDHAKAFAAIWASIKLGGFVSQMAQVALSMKASAASAAGMGASIGKAGGAVGKLSGALSVLGSFGVGFGIGTAIDELTGASDKISKSLVEAKFGSKSFQDTAFLRERADEVGGANFLASVGGGGLVGQDVLSSARDLLNAAQGAGVIGEGGKVDARRAAEVTTKNLSPFQQAQLATGGETERGAQLRSEIETAQRLLGEAAAQRAKGFDVRVVVEDGRVTAVGQERTQGVE